MENNINNQQQLPQRTAGQKALRILSMTAVVLLLSGLGWYGSMTYYSYFWLTLKAGIFAGLGETLLIGLISIVVMTTLGVVVAVQHRQRPVLFTALVGLILILSSMIIGWGVGFVTHFDQLEKIATTRHNRSTVNSDTLEGCSTITDVNFWRTCISGKVTSQALRTVCESQAKKFSASADPVTAECANELAVATVNVRGCLDVPLNGTAFADQRLCIYDVLQKSWETNNRVTPQSVVEGCSAITNDIERQYCYIFSLRQLSAGSATTTLACQSLNPAILGTISLRAGEREDLQQKCGLVLTETK